MYVPTWQGLNPASFFWGESAANVPFPLNAPHSTYFYRARNAIYHLFRALRLQKEETVLVPAYHHGNEVRAIRAAGATIRFYPVNRTMEPDLDAMARLCRTDARVLFVIHYLGWPQPMEDITALCRERGLILIEDCALALLSETDGRPLGSFGDYAVYCLYKTLPLPHGGLLIQNRRVFDDLTRLALTPCDFLSAAGRTSELMVEWLRSRSNGAGQSLARLKRIVGDALTAGGIHRLPVGDVGFDLASVNTGMSVWAHRLLKRYDYEAIRQKRRVNFLRLLHRLDGRATPVCTDLRHGICPLFFPILVPDKRAAAQALRQHGIGAVEFWNHGDPEAAGDVFREAQFLRDHVLELPIHQDVTAEQVDYMAEQVLTLELHL